MSIKKIVILSVVAQLVLTGVGASPFLLFIGKKYWNTQRHIIPSFGNSSEYRGYKQEDCSEGTYSAWDGAAPDENGVLGTDCLTKTQIDRREDDFSHGASLKPAIFLYADKDTDFTVKLNFNISQSFVYPSFNDTSQNGWSGKVIAGENGKLDMDGKPYDYLFWEGQSKRDYVVDSGAVVSREDTVSYLEASLRALGLNARESGDFITFWGPKLYQNDYNLISFVNDQYAQSHPMDVTPAPDATIRVFMVYKSVGKNYEVTPQQFGNPPVRNGFSLVEWGGLELAN